MEQLSKGLGDTIPLACGDWAATKAAYRFLDNDRVSEQEILAGHFAATQARFAALDGPILVLHDTTEFSFTRSDTAAIGQTHRVAKGHKDKKGRQRMHTVCGMLMHSSLAITPDGLPLGLAAIKLWTRKKFKGTNALQGRGLDSNGKHSVNMTRIPIEQKESIRWLENVRQATANLGEPPKPRLNERNPPCRGNGQAGRMAPMSENKQDSTPPEPQRIWVTAGRLKPGGKGLDDETCRLMAERLKEAVAAKKKRQGKSDGNTCGDG